jgi:hypothetical protein
MIQDAPHVRQLLAAPGARLMTDAERKAMERLTLETHAEVDRLLRDRTPRFRRPSTFEPPRRAQEDKKRRHTK